MAGSRNVAAGTTGRHAPFDSAGGLGKMFQLFGDKMDPLIAELNEVLVA